MPRKSFLVAFLFAIIFNSYSQTRLSQAKNDLKKTNSSSRSASSSDDDDDDVDYSLLIELAEPVIRVFGFVTYGLLVESQWERDSDMHYARFTPYPYALENYGDYIYNPPEDLEGITPVRVSINNSLVRADSKLFGNHLNAQLRFGKRFSLDAGYLQLFEESPFGTESFSLFNATLNYYRVRTPNFMLWYGPGVTYIGNEVNRFGFTLNAGAEWFVAKPISLYANYKHAFLGSGSVDIFESRLKYHLNRYNISGGYERYQLGSVGLSNFAVGVGVTF